MNLTLFSSEFSVLSSVLLTLEEFHLTEHSQETEALENVQRRRQLKQERP